MLEIERNWFWKNKYFKSKKIAFMFTDFFALENVDISNFDFSNV